MRYLFYFLCPLGIHRWGEQISYYINKPYHDCKHCMAFKPAKKIKLK